MKHLNRLTALMLCLAPATWAARITGTTHFSATLTSSSSAVTFAAAAPSQITAVASGSPTGPNFVQTTLTAAASNFGPNGIFANADMDLSAGAGTSFFGAFADAISGVVRVTNSSSADAPFQVSSQTLLYALQTFGPTSAFISTSAAIERFNAQTNQWDIIGVTSFGLSTNQSNSACTPACAGGFSAYTIAANSTADIRLHTRLQGSASQDAAVPEPSTMTLTIAAIAVLAAGRAARRA